MPFYNYHPRGIGSTQAKIPAKAIYTSLTLRNIQSQYTRPKLIFTGPQPMIQSNNSVWPWPWMCPEGSPSEFWIGDRLDRINWWPMHLKGTLRISLRLLVAAFYSYENSTRKPFNLFDHPINLPLEFNVDIEQLVNSSDSSPLVGGFITTQPFSNPRSVRGFIATDVYLGSTILQQVHHQMASNNRNMVREASTKLCQVGAEDNQVFQNVSFDIDYDLTDALIWGSVNALRQNPLRITVRCNAIDPNSIAWPSIYNDAHSAPLKSPKFIRIFNTSSSYYEQGRL